MSWRVIEGDCLDVLRELAPESVQTVVTSPPYWGLRDYGTATWEGGDPGCSHRVGGQVEDNMARGAIVAGVRPGVDASTCLDCGAERTDSQLGLEPTPEQYVANLVAVFREVRRVLRADGTVWLNLGDSYAGSWGAQGRRETPAGISGNQINNHPTRASNTGTIRGELGLKPKDLVGIPWRVAFALQADGWWLRSDIIWAKPNPMPESVTDRPTRSHEYIFLLSKSARYFYDADAIREVATVGDHPRTVYDNGPREVPPGSSPHRGLRRQHAANKQDRTAAAAAAAGGSSGRRMAEFNKRWDQAEADGTVSPGHNKRSVWAVTTQPFPGAHFATFPPKLIEPCVLAGTREGDTVLDPFCGAGTTGLVSLRHNRDFIGIDLNADYVEMARQRIRDDAPLLNVGEEAA